MPESENDQENRVAAVDEKKTSSLSEEKSSQKINSNKEFGDTGKSLNNTQCQNSKKRPKEDSAMQGNKPKKSKPNKTVKKKTIAIPQGQRQLTHFFRM